MIITTKKLAVSVGYSETYLFASQQDAMTFATICERMTQVQQAKYGEPYTVKTVNEPLFSRIEIIEVQLPEPIEDISIHLQAARNLP